MVTVGDHWRSSRVRRWSNQCAVESCSARNRDIGGSSRPGRMRHTVSATPPAAWASLAGTRHDGAGTPQAVQMPARSSATGRGSPFVTTYELAVHRLGPIEGCDDRRDRVIDVRRVDECSATADDRQAPAPGAVDDATDELRVARPPHEMRPHDDDREARCISGEREEFGRGFRARIVSTGSQRLCRTGGVAYERRAHVGDGRRRDLHETTDARAVCFGEQSAGAPHVDAIEFGWCAGQGHFRGEMDDRVDALDGSVDTPGVRYIAQHVGGTCDARRPPLERSYVVALAHE